MNSETTLPFPISATRNSDAVLAISQNNSDKSIKIANINKTAEKLLKRNKESLIGTNFLSVLPEEIQDIIETNVDFSDYGNDIGMVLRTIRRFTVLDNEDNNIELAIKIFPISSNIEDVLLYELLVRDRGRKILQDVIHTETIGDDPNSLPAQPYIVNALDAIQKYAQDNAINGSLTIVRIDEYLPYQSDSDIKESENLKRQVYDILLDSCRDDDVVAYIENGMFAAVLFDCSIYNAKIVCNRLRMTIERRNFVIGTKQFKSTASFVITDILNKGDTDNQELVTSSAAKIPETKNCVFEI